MSVKVADTSEYMWAMCERAKQAHEEDPTWLKNIAETESRATVILVYIAMAEIPQEYRGDWFEQAVPLAQRHLNDGARRWLRVLREQLLTGEGEFIPYLRRSDDEEGYYVGDSSPYSRI